MAIRVLVISDYRNPVSTRPEAEIFLGLAKLGFDISVMTFPDSPVIERFESAGINVIRFHPKKRWSRSESRIIRDELITGSHDIVHLFNGKAMLNGLRAAHGLPVKVVLYRGYTGNVHWFDPTAWYKVLSPWADAIMCNSQSVARQINRQLFFPKRKTVVITKGHDVGWYADVQPASLSEFGIPEDAFVVSCVANARKMKGIRYLVEGFCQIPDDQNVYLLLIGRGMTKYKRHVSAAYVDKLVITGFRRDVLSLVAAGDVFVLSSIKGESMTKAAIQAMALGVPPIITSIPGNVGLVVDGQSGLIVPPRSPGSIAEAIMRLSRDSSLRNQIGKAAHVRIRDQFNHSSTVTGVKQLYERLTAINSA